MTVSTIASVASGIPRAISTQNTKASLSASAVASAQGTPVDREVVTYPSELQKQASLRAAVQGVAHVAAQLDATSAGASEISSLVSQLQGIATRASSGGLTDAQRTSLTAEFQSLRARLNNVTVESSFEGASLLDGKAPPVQIGDQTVKIGGFTEADLFGENSDINVATPEAAQKAVNTLATAEEYVINQQAIIGTAQADVEYTATTLESAVQNQEASQSSVTETDIAQGTGPSTQTKVQAQSADALLAQTNRLPADILRLLAE